ncbi:hypothetical protein ACIRNI_08040 [Streptomyces sp. NPDC093546]|uniref:hypothetical protein n=1 Tax=Streptomyces sp. NPDC093546 TaxID=3366040 RepID=UPI003820A735
MTTEPTEQRLFVLGTLLLPCEPCCGARIFGGSHDCTGTTSMGLTGREIVPVRPAPCPCDHRP